MIKTSSTAASAAPAAHHTALAPAKTHAAHNGYSPLRLVKTTDIGVILHADETHLLDEYIAAKAAEKEAKETVENLQPAVKTLLKDLQEEGHIDKTLIHAGFEFQFKTKVNYCFSGELEELLERVNFLKEQEIKNGAAQVKSETLYIALVPVKAN